MGGSNMLAQNSGMLLCVALMLMTLFMSEASILRPSFWEQQPADDATAGWLPWVVLITLGFASGGAAVLYPLPSTAILG
jgi:hypothetical protein